MLCSPTASVCEIRQVWLRPQTARLSAYFEGFLTADLPKGLGLSSLYTSTGGAEQAGVQMAVLINCHYNWQCW